MKIVLAGRATVAILFKLGATTAGLSFSDNDDVCPRILQLLLKSLRTDGSVTAAHGRGAGRSFVQQSSENFFFFTNSTAQPSNTILLTGFVQRCALFYLQAWVGVGESGHAGSCLHASRVVTLNRPKKNKKQKNPLFGDTDWLYLKFCGGVWYGESVHATLRAPWLEDVSAVREGGRSVLHHASFHLCWRQWEKKIIFFFFLNSEKSCLVPLVFQIENPPPPPSQHPTPCDFLHFSLLLLMDSMDYVTLSNLTELETECKTWERLEWPRVVNDLGMSPVRCCERGCWQCPVAPAAGAVTPCCWRRLWSAAAPAGRWRPSAAAPDPEAAPSPPGRSWAPPAAARPCLWLSSPGRWMKTTWLV